MAASRVSNQPAPLPSSRHKGTMKSAPAAMLPKTWAASACKVRAVAERHHSPSTVMRMQVGNAAGFPGDGCAGGVKAEKLPLFPGDAVKQPQQ